MRVREFAPALPDVHGPPLWRALAFMGFGPSGVLLRSPRESARIRSYVSRASLVRGGATPTQLQEAAFVVGEYYTLNSASRGRDFKHKVTLRDELHVMREILVAIIN